MVLIGRERMLDTTDLPIEEGRDMLRSDRGIFKEMRDYCKLYCALKRSETFRS